MSVTITMDGKYTTRRGDPVRILCVDAKIDGGYEVVGIYKGTSCTWTAQGIFNQQRPSEPDCMALDLIPVQPPTALEAAARKVVEFQGESFTWADLKAAIADLAAALGEKP